MSNLFQGFILKEKRKFLTPQVTPHAKVGFRPMARSPDTAYDPIGSIVPEEMTRNR
jgi:hypothetical protein